MSCSFLGGSTILDWVAVGLEKPGCYVLKETKNINFHWQDFNRLLWCFHLHSKGPFTFIITVQCNFCYSQAVLKSSKFQVSSNFLHHQEITEIMLFHMWEIASMCCVKDCVCRWTVRSHFVMRSFELHQENTWSHLVVILDEKRALWMTPLDWWHNPDYHPYNYF